MTYITGQLLYASQLNALLASMYPASGVSTYSGTLLTQTAQAGWLSQLGLPSGTPGSANGLATLDGSGKLPSGQLTAIAFGSLNYQGSWNASINSPPLVSGTGTKGYYYKVSVAGTTTIDGNSLWAVGDIIAFDGTTWDKFDGANVQVTSTQISDSTSFGRALLTGASVLAQRVSLNIDQATSVADTNQTMTNAMDSVAWTSLTAARVGTLPSAATMNVGQTIYIFDESGNCSPTNTITINRAGSDTINGGTSYVMSTPYASLTLTRVTSTKWTAVGSSQAPVRGEIGGLTLSNDGGSPNTVIDIAVGSATSDDNSVYMTLGSAYTKSIASNWAVGTGNGGLDTGSVAASTWYHVYLIQRTDTGVVDALLSLSATSPTMPTSYTKKRRIGAIKTDGSSHILAFVQNGDEFLWATPVNDISTTTLGTTPTLIALSVPLGVKVNALMRCFFSNASGAQFLINSPDETSTAANTPSGNLTSVTTSTVPMQATLAVRTNTSSQIRAVASAASSTLTEATYGYIDSRGKFN